MVYLKNSLGLSALLLLGHTTSAMPVSSLSSTQLEARSAHGYGHGDFANPTPHISSRDPGNDDDHDHHHHHVTIASGGAGGAPGEAGQPGQPGEWTVVVSPNGDVITSKGGDGGKVIVETNPNGLNVSIHDTAHSEHANHPVSSGSLAVFGGSALGPYWYCFAALSHAVGYYVLTH